MFGRQSEITRFASKRDQMTESQEKIYTIKQICDDTDIVVIQTRFSKKYD